MRMTHMNEVGTELACIELVDYDECGASVTEIRDPAKAKPWEVNLDFDVEGRLVSIEMVFIEDEGVPPEFVALCEPTD